MSEYLEVLKRRIAVLSFQPASNISSQDLNSLIEDATLAPSSFNLQPCRFIAITTPELKSALANITLPANRQKVMDASLCLLFVGDTLAHTDLAQRLDECVAAGTLTREVADEWLGFVSNVYSRSNELIRDEMIRSCSLAAMVFMLSATNKGLDTCPIGFNPGGLIASLRLPERYIPVMLLAVGKSTQRSITRRSRRAVPDLLTVNESPGGWRPPVPVVKLQPRE